MASTVTSVILINKTMTSEHVSNEDMTDSFHLYTIWGQGEFQLFMPSNVENGCI